MNYSRINFFFHDYETFGINPATDRPAQFAGIYTDSELNPIKQPELFYCRLPNDYIPQPKSVLINGITPQLAIIRGFSEAEFAKRIYNILNIKKICIVGYNNIQFDDEVTRNIFYRNFYDPYSWSWKHGNSRWDILNLTRACHALRPEGISWPKNKNGFTSFKLQHLTQANNLTHNDIHNAISDVHATIEIAKLIKKKQPKLFDFFLKNRTKERLISMIDIIGMKPLVHVSSLFGSLRNNISLILPLAWHPNNRNALIVIDLYSDIYPLLKLDILSIQKFLINKNKELNLEDIPVKLVHMNKCPILSYVNTLRLEDQIRLKINLAHCFNNLELIRNNPTVRKKIVTIFEQKKQVIASDVDNRLYDGFFSTSDKAKMHIIHKTEPKLLSTLNLKFESSRLKALLFRYRARNFPWTLDDNEQKFWKKHCQNILNNQNIRKFLLELKILKKLYGNNRNKIKILRSLYFYLKSIIS
ncbi:exodeoxyribonuclease I [Candidatus Pantoea edessiphila]|uniref:Exodeoxyribonuclease I n=1 Tax=Candidatus Pantoea edessiphila TaxID=2044610 RepID=A0A2P5T0U3_9GAMM|nr:exodeoxyribonuclease I [Candidatus Pantoea edessiphila]PPI88201.1 exodeoxyribonuclease I [Candidatus Pantoea edessiphila]